MVNLELKKADFAYRGMNVEVTYFLSSSGAVLRFDVSAALSQKEEKIGASIQGWETESDAMTAARTLAAEAIDKHLLGK
ncbi:hypothetical protein [Pseudomonas sp. 06C 126]|uniref:hypothetical protein n=1 Tax=Pseudomonas sp. 06C 126 TaxID=1917281 RepID=UPI0008DAD087|nr:hypothetical protein [Pseudomonas sp. 06C 126]OHW37945.1 hypothetical protein BHC62_06400 [Pseudomonas sp. 06C 126]